MGLYFESKKIPGLNIFAIKFQIFFLIYSWNSKKVYKQKRAKIMYFAISFSDDI